MTPIACVGDRHLCPRHGPNVIATGSSETIHGRPIAVVGSLCACGCTILTGSSVMTIHGKQVAIVGSKTSKGGTIVSGASAGKA